MIEPLIQPEGPAVAQVGCWMTAAGEYYEGDRIGTDRAVPARPSQAHVLQNGGWVHDRKKGAAKAIQDLEAQQAAALTPRALREFIVATAEAAKISGIPAVAELKGIDDMIKAERGNL